MEKDFTKQFLKNCSSFWWKNKSIKNDFYNFFFVVVNRARILALVPYQNAYHVSPFSPKNNEMYFFSPYRSALCHSPVAASTRFMFLFPTSLSAGKSNFIHSNKVWNCLQLSTAVTSPCMFSLSRT